MPFGLALSSWRIFEALLLKVFLLAYHIVSIDQGRILIVHSNYLRPS